MVEGWKRWGDTRLSGRVEVEVREETLSDARCLGEGGKPGSFQKLSQTTASLKIALLAVSNQPLQVTLTTFVPSSPGCKR